MKALNEYESVLNDITTIDPVYDFSKEKSSVSGYFNVQLGTQSAVSSSFRVKFSSVMNHKAAQDNDLFAFLMNNYGNKTLSDAVYDLYDTGFPVDQWVKEYLAHIVAQFPMYAAMLAIEGTLSKFNEDPSGEDDLLI